MTETANTNQGMTLYLFGEYAIYKYTWVML